MHNYASILAALWALACGPGWLTFAAAHSWYPNVCCNDADCAPVEAVSQLVLVDGSRQLVVTSKHGTALVPKDFPSRHSKDGRMHICMRSGEEGTMDVMCLFLPPQM
jgi:hypothetical protein